MTDRLEFGELTCGDSRSGSAVIENPSFEDVPWRARVEPRELFELDTSDGSLAAHGELGLLVTATARVAMLRPGTEVAGVLRVDVGGSLPNHFDVPLHFRASGAWLDVPATLDFGLVSLGESATDMLRLSNTGDRSVRVSFALSGDPSLSLDAALLDLSPGATGGPTIRVSPASAGVIRGEARVSFAGPLCNEARPTANVVASVTGDSLLVSPTILDLGDVRCGDPLASGTISVKNRGSVAVPWSGRARRGRLLLFRDRRRFRRSARSRWVRDGGGFRALDEPRPGTAL